MKRVLASAAMAAALVAGSASADVLIGFNEHLAKEFDAERTIVQLVKDNYGAAAVYDNRHDLPARISEALVPGATIPAGAPVQNVPSKIAGKLPHTEDGTVWHKVGENLVEVRADGTIAMVVYDVLG